MPFNGSGLFSLIYNWQNDAAQGLNISSSRMQNQDADIASGLSLCLTKDGQQTPVANIPMGGFRLTNMGNATQQGNAVTVQDVQNGSVVTLTAVAGVDTITANTTPSITAYAAGQCFDLPVAGANLTNAVTLNVNGLGAKNVTKFGGYALNAGDFQSGMVPRVRYDGTEFQIVNMMPVRAGYSVRRLQGANNAGTPATKFDVSAEAVTVFNPTSGDSTTIRNTGTITCDLTLAGPAANGRDQAAAFAAAQWLHFYFIWNGSSLRTTVSSSAPSGGPALPTGYTSWAYIGSVYYSAGGALVNTYIRGSRCHYQQQQAILINGASTVETAIATSVLIPPNALDFTINVGSWAVTSDAGGNLVAFAVLRVASGVDFARMTDVATTVAASTSSRTQRGPMIEVPATGALYYLWSISNGSAPALTLYVQSYRIPNGGE